MIKKITNWTIGSIFRTIGRFLAYFLIAMLIALFFTKKDYVKADTWKSGVVTWTDENGNVLPQYYGQYREFNYGTNYANYQYRMIGATNVPAGTKGVLYSVVFRQVHNSSQFVCTQTYANSNDCFTWTSNSAQNMSFVQMYNGESQVFNCYWYDNTFTTILDNNTYIRGLLYCPVTNTTNINRLEYNGKITTTQSNVNTYSIGFEQTILYDVSDGASIIENQNEHHQEAMNYFNSTISGEVNGTGENGTITDEDAQSNSCGIICKLKHLIEMLSIDNIKYIVVPTEEQMNDLFNQMQEKITSKLGILGLPVTIYTRLMQIAMQYEEGQQNWCLTWNAVQVPNFEDFNIIQAGGFCFSDLLQNEKINTFRTTCHMIIGGLILLSFIQYLFNCLHRILDVPIQDNYEYFTTEDVYGIDTDTGEVQSHTIKSRRTTRRPL